MRYIWKSFGIFSIAMAVTATAIACSSSPAGQGRQDFTKYQCGTCHNTTGAPGGTGPSLKGIAGKEVKLVGGKTVIADDEYLRRSITQPDAEIVEGYSPGIMGAILTSYQADLAKPEVVNGLVEYIKSLK